MTSSQALKLARQRWGKTAMVSQRPKGAYVGEHGEFVEFISVRPKDSQYARAGHYFCQRCSTPQQRVYHRPGTIQTAYCVGHVFMGLGFMIEGEADSWSAAFAAADAKKASK
jgi:hypothetical protein